MRLRHVGYLVGAVIMAGSAFAYADASISERDIFTQPLSIPISFASGTEKKFELTTKMDAKFELVIDVEESQLHAKPMCTDISWQLLDAGSVIAHGNSADQAWRNWWGTFEQILGSFSGRSGRTYTLNLRIDRGTPQLDAAGAVLNVRIPRDDWEGYGMGVGFEKMGAGIMGFIGLIIVACSFQFRPRTKTRQITQP